MERRTFLGSALAAPLTATLRTPAALSAEAEPGPAWRTFELTTRVELQDSPGPAELWLPLAQTAARYQVASAPRLEGNSQASVVRDERYDAQMLRARWADGATPQRLDVVQHVDTRDRGLEAVDPSTRFDRRFWMAPTESVPTDGIVRETADRITAGRTGARDRLRALYDWVVDAIWRNPDTPGCGTGDVASMLETGNFGGKCADINGLMVALARAAGLPARDVYGIRVADSRLFPSLGKSGDVSKAQHCRAEVYVDGEGWFPVDPADVRKVVLEQRLPLDSPEGRALRERMFGHWEMNWIGYNSATDLELPGAAGRKPNFAFLMYPCAFTATGQPNCLDPAHFRYEITAREVAA